MMTQKDKQYFKFNHNDVVQVILSKEGAEHLCNNRKAFNSKHKTMLKDDYKEGNVYYVQFWSLIKDFHDVMNLGTNSPFKNGDIEGWSSVESGNQ